MRIAGALLAALLVTGCQTTREVAEVAALVCVPLETKAWFSCWWSANDAPLTHCVLMSEDEPRCGLKRKAGDYFNRGATNHFDPVKYPDGTWFGLSIFEDSEGRVGQLVSSTDGTDYLANHSASPIPTGATKPPVWPRFPSGLEFGPEQVRRR